MVVGEFFQLADCVFVFIFEFISKINTNATSQDNWKTRVALVELFLCAYWRKEKGDA